MSNEYIDWIEKSIADEYITYYEYSDLKLIQPSIGHDSFGDVISANWRCTDCIFALKSFKNEKRILKEVINEV